MDTRRAFWPAGSEAIARGAPSAPFTKSISPMSNKDTGFSTNIDSRIDEKGKGTEEDEDKKKSGSEQPGASSQQRSGKKSDGEDLDDEDWLAAYEEEDVNSRKEGSRGGGESAAPPPDIPDVPDHFEVRKHSIARRPALPTKAEIDEHYPLHLHYRSCCKHCVAGKARSNQHPKKDKAEERLGVT